MDSFFVKCPSCGAQNKVLISKINSQPKCGKCGSMLKILDKPIDINYSDYKKEVLDYKGHILLYLWSPT